MKPLGLGEHGGLTIVREGSSYVAYLRYRDFAGRGRRIKRSGRSRAEASREVLKAVKVALGTSGDDEYTAKTTFDDAAKGWLEMFAAQVERGARSPSTYDEYRHVVKRVIEPGVGSLRLGELTTPRLDRFVQAVLVDRGYATAKLTRSVLSGICSWLVRRGAIPSNPVRDLTPLELDRDRTARALSFEEVRTWLAILDSNEFAQRHDLPELARFMLATGLRLGEALGVTWADLDLAAGTIAVRRTIIRVQGKGLVANRVKSRASERGLILPAWCIELLKQRRVRLGGFDGPIFPDSHGGWRDRSNVGKAFRRVREGSEFDWVKTHTYRKTVATLLDRSGATARMIADQLGHSRVSMTQDVYLGRRATNATNVVVLEAYNPDGVIVEPRAANPDQ
ncbi:site-specific integrase [Microlunatus panaciterrae]|uniref:Integrase n=1 Tax=Microlunatus panaciterrae TaxID=400768 RepID=A0ABS2RK23_9ACTN|nr:site-specific integrase [Microlunatus panaciterrae]MBM7799356.1 integrase [Microlunatus panaciterrae]